MNDEKHRVLEMLANGKITVEEASELLQAVEPAPGSTSSARSPEAPAQVRRARWLRMTLGKNVEAGRKKEINLRIPASLFRAGVRLGSLLNDGKVVLAGGLNNLASIDGKQLEELLDNMGEMTIDMDEGRAQMRIWCE